MAQFISKLSKYHDETKLNKVMKVIKILNKINQVIHVHIT